MSTKHTTPLSHHVREKIFWVDISILGALWLISGLSGDSFQYSKLLKIVALMATLDVIGFFSFHALGSGRSLLIQGFLGGIVSSTGTFLRLCSRHRIQENELHPLSQSLLLAMTAMLFECLLIIYALVPDRFLPIATPVLIQTGLILVFISLSRGRSTIHGQIEGLNELIEKPIIWVRVLKISVLIAVLVYGMRFFNEKLDLDPAWGAFIASFFEAHAITAASMGADHLSTESAQKIMLFILTGNAISKSLIVLKSGSKKLFFRVGGLLMMTLLASWIIRLFFFT